MTGTIKNYVGNDICKECCRLTGAGAVTSFKSTDGTTITQMYAATSSSVANYQPFQVSAATAYSGNFDYSDYQKVDEASTTLISSVWNTTTHTYTEIVSITATSNITLTAIKFYKNLYAKIGSGGQNKETLMFGYFFDTPIIMAIGETKTFTIVID